MTLDEAKEILNGCTRSELRDHAFGDVEVYWERDGGEIGSGYFGSGQGDVSVLGKDDIYHSFKDSWARELRNCGTLAVVERNDSTGPDAFAEGSVAPGLTLGEVLEELTGK